MLFKDLQYFVPYRKCLSESHTVYAVLMSKILESLAMDYLATLKLHETWARTYNATFKKTIS